jgi:hypothetical protein
VKSKVIISNSKKLGRSWFCGGSIGAPWVGSDLVGGLGGLDLGIGIFGKGGLGGFLGFPGILGAGQNANKFFLSNYKNI